MTTRTQLKYTTWATRTPRLPQREQLVSRDKSVQPLKARKYFRYYALLLKRTLLTRECYKAWRHQRHLPANGQRTRSNAKTVRQYGST